MRIAHKSQYANCAYLNIIFEVIIVCGRIKDLREDRDLSQMALAELLSVNQATYSRYESGGLNIPNISLIKLADSYEVSIDYLLGRTNDKRLHQL